jgi:coniferyl-aldehyde dehydrogenase
MTVNIAQQPETNPEIASLMKIFSAQKAAFRKNSNPSAEARIAHLNALKDMLIKYQDRLTEAINTDYGHRSSDEFKLGELLVTLEGLKYCRKHVHAWMRPERRHVSLLHMPSRARVEFQPLGVVGIIAPWNYPIFTAMSPLMYALAAGNRAIIKMSDFTPCVAAVFQRMIAEVFAADHVAVCLGNNEVSEAFPKLPFDQITFTGSTRIGRVVMAEASKNLTPVLLELGGKSPTIVHASFPLDDAVERIAFGKCWNAGQTCIAPDHLYLPRGKTGEFVKKFTTCIGTMYPTLASNPDYTAVINDRQYSRLQGYLDDARSLGASIIAINPDNESFAGTRKMPVTLVTGVTPDMELVKNEIFGPVLPIMEYDDIDDLLAVINSQPRPLALYYFDYDESRADHVIKNTCSGGVTVNDVMVHAAVDDLPFGGVGPAGMGRYHGREGFLSMSNIKSVLVKSRLSTLRFILPPFNKRSHAFIKKFLVR